MANMSVRMRRIASDWEQIQRDFTGHKNIIITPVGTEPPEKYHVTYFVNGIYLLPDGKIETLSRHEVEITLHSDYPRYKPICKILTPIWHPNFRDGQICIGDIWGAGESLSDIIVNIGDMIQYKSWNSYSPLSADAAQWAMDNRHLFPIGNVELYMAEADKVPERIEIDLFDDESEEEVITETPEPTPEPEPEPVPEPVPVIPEDDGNDFEITAEELAGIEFVPTAQRIQGASSAAKGKRINFKTILTKGLLWAIIGAFLGFIVSEVLGSTLLSDATAAKLAGHPELVDYYSYDQQANNAFEVVNEYYEDYCRINGLNAEDTNNMGVWIAQASETELTAVEKYLELSDKADEALYNAYINYAGSDEEFFEQVSSVTRMSTAMWSAVIALFIGLLLGLGEGIFYGSGSKAAMYGAIGAVISLVIGFGSGYVAQLMYAELLGDDPTAFMSAFVRGLGWAIMGLGVGISIGLIKPQVKRIVFCALGGLVGAFLGGFLFNYILEIVPNDVVSRGVAIVIMGMLIGLGVGLLEQFAKQAWLKVIRGEFEGKEYLVFAGTTSIGNNSKNSIVLFKDKLVAPHHCDIVLEGSKYVIVDKGTPMGTVVNGMKSERRILRQGDTIAIGNSVLVFHTK
ncbi:MAG: FHA domain-containing protein [Oscillospiraceae bacterium]|nr:FHA domain-containing protein [Oscillospiraceae bacterium]